jgi:glycosyltransferase involved in cell wall biosynthesis
MKIAYDHQIFYQQPFGGISRYFTNLASQLVEAGETVNIFSPTYCNRYLGSLPGDVVRGHYIAKYPPKTMRLVYAYNNLISKYQIGSWKPDLLHETYYSRPGLAPKKCAIVTTVYDMIHEIYREEFSDGGRTSRLKLESIKRADHIICISESTKKDLIEIFNVPHHKVSVVLLAFDQFYPNSNLDGNATGSYAPYLLYVGSRAGYKNFAAFIEAIASSKGLMSDMNVICFGGGSFGDAEIAMFKRLGFKERQIQQISGDDELLGSFYRGAQAFVCPSLYEGFGIPPLEAMAHNCPVICSNTSSIPEVVGDAGKYFNPSDVGDMCRSIESVVYDESVMRELKMLGSERLQNFSWKKCADQTLAIYKQLAS